MLEAPIKFLTCFCTLPLLNRSAALCNICICCLGSLSCVSQTVHCFLLSLRNCSAPPRPGPVHVHSAGVSCVTLCSLCAVRLALQRHSRVRNMECCPDWPLVITVSSKILVISRVCTKLRTSHTDQTIVTWLLKKAIVRAKSKAPVRQDKAGMARGTGCWVAWSLLPHKHCQSLFYLNRSARVLLSGSHRIVHCFCLPHVHLFILMRGSYSSTWAWQDRTVSHLHGIQLCESFEEM